METIRNTDSEPEEDEASETPATGDDAGDAKVKVMDAAMTETDDGGTTEQNTNGV